VSGRSEQHEKQADEYVNVFQTERIYDSALFKDMFVISDDVRLCHGEKQPKTGVAKYFDPRAKFATAWPLEARYNAIHVTGSSQSCCTAVHSRKRGA